MNTVERKLEKSKSYQNDDMVSNGNISILYLLTYCPALSFNNMFFIKVFL